MERLSGTGLSATVGRAVALALVPAVVIGISDAVRRPGHGLDLDHLKFPRVA